MFSVWALIFETNEIPARIAREMAPMRQAQGLDEVKEYFKLTSRCMSTNYNVDSRIALRRWVARLVELAALDTEIFDCRSQNLDASFKFSRRHELSGAVGHPDIAGTEDHGFCPERDHAGRLSSKSDSAGFIARD